MFLTNIVGIVRYNYVINRVKQNGIKQRAQISISHLSADMWAIHYLSLYHQYFQRYYSNEKGIFDGLEKLTGQKLIIPSGHWFDVSVFWKVIEEHLFRLFSSVKVKADITF